ncbi:hypothetical protein PAT3040_05485, partial [Paenibacillus agaridevorans]
YIAEFSAIFGRLARVQPFIAEFSALSGRLA